MKKSTQWYIALGLAPLFYLWYTGKFNKEQILADLAKSIK